MERWGLIRGGVPRSLGDVLDDKRGISGDNSWRRRRDVQNICERR